MKRLILILMMCMTGSIAWAMDEDEGTNGEEPAGCEENPSLCSQPDSEPGLPQPGSSACSECSTWQATCGGFSPCSQEECSYGLSE